MGIYANCKENSFGKIKDEQKLSVSHKYKNPCQLEILINLFHINFRIDYLFSKLHISIVDDQLKLLVDRLFLSAYL